MVLWGIDYTSSDFFDRLVVKLVFLQPKCGYEIPTAGMLNTEVAKFAFFNKCRRLSRKWYEIGPFYCGFLIEVARRIVSLLKTLSDICKVGGEGLRKCVHTV